MSLSYSSGQTSSTPRGEVVELAQRKGLILIAAESCTSGLLSLILSEAPGAAELLHGGVVTYTKPPQERQIGRALGAVAGQTRRLPEVAG